MFFETSRICVTFFNDARPDFQVPFFKHRKSSSFFFSLFFIRYVIFTAPSSGIYGPVYLTFYCVSIGQLFDTSNVTMHDFVESPRLGRNL